ncbi:lysophospholipid acyltransferase family protein [Cognatiluteimonas telluris]|jgi:1-acyl-sn-glycerol-3-phosphate acyltransferase|uniref:lysophospholipid acyltransferase family protein n=1 Tax=Cognatiluteimonas telluris TaxID=1104775 RepID=UPI00140DB820|nr:lysophospholipid acyltransferase family protein [Lysobacter telluris]
MSVVGSRAGQWPLRHAAWAVFNALQLVFTLAWTAGWICLALLVRLLGARRLPLRMAARCWAPGLLGGAGARLDVAGLEGVDWSRPLVLVANHQSVIDACALFRVVPTPLRFVLKQEMTRMPFVGWYARCMGMVFIERGSARSSPQRLREAVELVRGGAQLCAFPEGTRSRDGSVGPFKGGVLQVAIAAGVPVVPVAISGSGAVLPSAGFRVRPGTIRLRFGTPIATTGLQVEDRNRLARQAREAVIDLLHPAPGR